MVATVTRTPASVVSGTWNLNASPGVSRLDAVSTNDGDTSGIFIRGDQAQTPASYEEAYGFVWSTAALPADAYIVGFTLNATARGYSGDNFEGASFLNALRLSVDGIGTPTTRGVSSTYQAVSGTFNQTPVLKPSSVQITGRLRPGTGIPNDNLAGVVVTRFDAQMLYSRPPQAPTITSPEHESTVATGTPTFTGTHNSPTNDGLGQVQIEVRQVSNNAGMWSTTFSASGFTWSRTYAGQSLTPGTAYMVRARTRNANLDVWSPWSDWVHFVPQFNRAPVANTSSPKGGAIVSTATPSLTWTYSDPDGDPQSAYQIQLRPVGGAVIWDTGQVAAASNLRSRTYNGPSLTEDQPYEWRIRCWDSQGNVSEYSSWALFTYSRLPQPPTLDIDPLIDTLTPTITGTYNKGQADDEAGYYYEIRQAGVVIYQSGFVSGAIATGQAYGTSNPLESPSPAPALQWGTTYQIRARSRDIQGKESSWSGWVTFRTQAPPTTPTNLSPRDSITGNTTPRLSWRHNDPDGDPQTAVEIELRDAATDVVVGDYGPLYIEQSEQFHDLLETLTDNPATQYKWRVRTTATPGAGWSPWSDWAFFTVTVAPELTVISPEEGEVLTTPALVVSWQMTGGSGTQQSAHVRIYADDEVTLVYDSGVIVGTTDSHAVPVTVLKNEKRYFVRVEVTDTLNLTAQSSLIAISTLWAPPPVIEGVTIQAIGDQLDGIPYTAGETFNPLPNLYLTWEPSNEPIATFLRYVIRRRRVGDTDWLVLATITMQDVAFYNDYEVASDTPYEYVVTQVVDVVGEEVESEFHEPAQGQVTIRSLFVHPLDAPTEYVELLVQAQSPSIQQPRTYVQPWGARAPVAHVGAALYATIDVDVSDAWSPRVWRALINLLERQANGSVLMIRQHRDIAHYVQMEGPSRSDRSTLMSVRLRFTEVDHTPGVEGS